MQFIRFFVLIGAALSLVSCGAMPPGNSGSQYLKTETGGFTLDRGKREVSYYLALLAQKPLPGGSVLEAQFENPAGGPSLNTTHQVAAGQTKIVLTSSPVTGVKDRARYQVNIKLYSDATKSQLVDSYTQVIQSFVNQAGLGW